MTLTVRIDDRQFKEAVKGFDEYLRGTRTVMIIIGRGLRDYTKETIRMGGRPTAPWDKLSRWTTGRTGRTKPLQGLERLIQYHSTRNSAELYAAETGKEWDVDQHHRGWYIPSREYHMMKGMLSGRKIFFSKAKGAHVEARPFWPTEDQAERIASDAVVDWVEQGARKKWH